MLRQVVPFVVLSFLCQGGYAGALPADPTRPADSAVVTDVADKAQPYSVSSVITGKKHNLAVINGQRVKVGDVVDGAKVIAVSRTGVQLNVSGEKRFISLAERQGFSKIRSAK